MKSYAENNSGIETKSKERSGGGREERKEKRREKEEGREGIKEDGREKRDEQRRVHVHCKGQSRVNSSQSTEDLSRR